MILKNTKKRKTQFMNGNIDVDYVIMDIMSDNGVDVLNGWDYDNAIYSDGFIDAINDGKIPLEKLYPTDSYRFSNKNTEYHHIIFGDECYNVYFE
jgi:hypothetical protein